MNIVSFMNKVKDTIINKRTRFIFNSVVSDGCMFITNGVKF